MFEICKMTPLFSSCNVFSYTSIAFDGCYYYLTIKDKKKVVKLNECFQCMETFLTCRIYTSICYDNNENCFWGTSNGCCSELFKLNCNFREMAKISLEQPKLTFSGVSNYCDDNTLLVSTADKILSIHKSIPNCTKEITCVPGAAITGVTGVSPCYIYVFIKGASQKLRIIAKDGSLLEEICPPKGHLIEQVLYMGRWDNCDHFQMLTLKQGCYPYIINAKLEKSVLGKLCDCNYLYGANESHSCPLPSCDCNACLPAPCSPPSCPVTSCRPPCPAASCPTAPCPAAPCRPPCPVASCPPSSCPIAPPCRPPRPPAPCPPDPSCPPACPPCCCPPHPTPCPEHNCVQTCNDVLESIALEETAIAHILNAEGEKIQKAIASTNKVSELLEVNREVNRTIIYVTQLEQVLYAKLDALRDCCKNCHSDCKCKPILPGHKDIDCNK